MTYISITDVNETDTIRTTKLSYNNPDTDSSFEGLYVSKFKLVTQTFPVYCPIIVRQEAIKRLNLPNSTNVTSLDWAQSDYMSDWCITILDTTTNKYSCQPVKWIPQKDQNLRPGFFPQRYDVLKNRYFWAYNSIHVLKVLESTIDRILADIDSEVGDIIMIKRESTFQILSLKENLKIFFNYPLRQAFNFYYSTDFQFANGAEIKDFNELIINKNITSEYGGGDYYTSQVLSLSSRLFPFSDLQFTTNRLPIEQIHISNNIQQSTQLKSAVVFSYGLDVTDIDSIVDKFYYTATSDFRKSLLKGNVKQFEIQIFFKTFDNFMVEVLLDKNDYSEIFLQFVDQETD